MAAPKPMLTEFGIHHRLESCEPESNDKKELATVIQVFSVFLGFNQRLRDSVCRCSGILQVCSLFKQSLQQKTVNLTGPRTQNLEWWAHPVWSRVSNATVSVANVENAHHSTRLLAQTTLRNILGTKNLHEILSDRESISGSMQVNIKIGESVKVIVTPPQIFVWVQKSPTTTKKVPKNSSNRFQIGLKGLVLWTPLWSRSVDRGSPGF